MKLQSVIFLCFLAFGYAKDCPSKRINSKLICYYSKLTHVDNCYCTHVILPANSDLKSIENLRSQLAGVKILLTVNEFNQGLLKTIKRNSIDGLEINLKKLDSKNDITEFINTVRSKLGNDLYLALSVPPKTELLAKYYDLKALSKAADLFILQTAFLGASKNVTFHPSRLSGLWDMQNTDSVVDLVTGMGAPLSKLAIAAPVQALQFKLQDAALSTPGSPALEVSTLTRSQLCNKMAAGNWTLERDQDQAGPYIYRGTQWIAFEDATSMDIKAKYARVRGLAGLALKDVSQDLESTNKGASKNLESCEAGASLLMAAYEGLSRQTRAPRQALLRSLEREILDTPAQQNLLSTVHVSPYRISRVVDVEGHVHVIRQDTRTEFECSRQGYFVHPHSCGRFYRCVKFDQQSDEFSVFEFDCPAGLAFDSRVEVCVWPGSLTDGAPCSGSSEIAPVPKTRFTCPSVQGYYADPENCRWFFACLDHGKSELTAYEFRCPFGLVFDEKRLICEWPWLVPSCQRGYITGLELDSIEFYGAAAKSTLHHSGAQTVGIGLQNGGQLHGLASSGHILDTYDGLGSLGTISLGGFNGDLNLLKASHGGNLALGYDSQHNLNLGLNGNAAFLNGLNGNADSNGHISGNIALLNSGNLNGNLGYDSQHNLNLGSNAYLSGLNGNAAGNGHISGNAAGNGHISGNIALVDSGESLGDKILLQNGGSSIQNGGSSLQNSGLLLQNGGLLLQNGGASSVEYHGNQGHDQKLLLDSGASLNTVGVLSGDSGYNSNNQAKIGVINFGANIGQTAGNGHSTVVNHGENNYKQSGIGVTLIDSGLSGENQDGYNSGGKLTLVAGSSEYNGNGNLREQNGVLLNSGEQYDGNFGQQEQVTLIDSGAKLSGAGILTNVDHGSKNILLNGNADYSSIYHGNGAKSSISSVELNGNNGYNNGEGVVLVDSGEKSLQSGQKLLLNSGANSGYSVTHHGNYGQGGKLAAVELQQNSGLNYETANIPLTLVDNRAKVATSTSTLNLNTNGNYAYNNEGAELINSGLNSGATIQYLGNGEQNYGNGYNYGNSGEKILLDSGLRSVDSGSKLATSTVTFHGNHQNGVKLTGGQYQTEYVQNVPLTDNFNTGLKYQYANEAKYVQPIISQVGGYDKYNADTVVLNTPKLNYNLQVPTSITYGSKFVHNGLTAIDDGNLYGESITGLPAERYDSNLTAVNYATNYLSVTPKPLTDINIVQHGSLVQNGGVRGSVNIQNGGIKVPVSVQNVGIKQTGSYYYQAPTIQENVPLYQSYSGPSKIESQFYGKQQQQSVQLNVQTPVETVSVSPKYETHYVKNVQIQQPVVVSTVQTPIETISVTPKYESQYYGKQVHEVRIPTIQQPAVFTKVETPIQTIQHVTPKYESQFYGKRVEEVQIPIQQQVLTKVETPIQAIQHVAPKYETHYYSKQAEIVQQPAILTKVETPIQTIQHVTPKYESQFYGKRVEQVQFPIQQQVFNKVETPVQTIQHVAPKYETHFYGKQAEIQQPAILTKVESPIQTIQHVTPKYESQFYGKHVEEIQVPIQQQVLTKVHTPIQTIQHVTPKYETQYYGKRIEEVQIPIQQQVLTKVDTPIQTIQHITPKYESQFYGKRVEEVQIPIQQQVLTKVETPIQTIQHVAPKYETQYYGKRVEEVQLPIQQQVLTKVETPIQTIQHVTPKYETHFYNKQAEIVQQPVFVSTVRTPVETVSVTPKYETQYYGKVDVNIPVVQQPIVHTQKIVQPIAPKYETQYYGKRVETVQPISYETQLPVVQKVNLLPKVETVSVTPNYNTQYYSQQNIQQVSNVQHIQKQPVFVSTVRPIETVSVTPRYETQYYGKQIQEIRQPISYEAQIPVQKVSQVVTPVKTVPLQTYESYSGPSKVESIFYGKRVQEKIPTQNVQTVTVAPTIVESYSYLPPKQQEINYESRAYLPPKTVNTVYVSTPKPRQYLPPRAEVFVSTTPKYAVFQDFVQPKQTFEIRKTVSPVISEYKYENRAYSNFGSNLDQNYYQPEVVEPIIQKSVAYTTGRPSVSTSVPLVPQNYQTEYIVSSPKPTFVSTIAPIIKQTPRIRTKVVAINKYDSLDNGYVVTSSRPTVLTQTLKPSVLPSASFSYYDSRYDTSSPKSNGASGQYLIETSDYSSPSYDEYVVTTSRPKIVSTVRPVLRKKIVSTTTAIPLDYSGYDDGAYGDYIVPKVDIVSTVRPVLRKKIKIVSTTPSPLLDIHSNYEDNYDSGFVTTARPVTTIRPIVKKKKIVTTTTALPLEIYDNYDDEYLVSSPEPIKLITPKPKGKTIVRVNDFHPFLTTKLGAQCTCTSNTVKLRKSRPRVEQIEQDYNFNLPESVPVTKLTSSGISSDESDEPGVYVVGNEAYDYDYEPQKLVTVTSSPEVIIKSTTNPVQPAPTPVYTIRKKVTSIRPIEVSSVTPTPIIISSTLASNVRDEIFLRKAITPAVVIKKARTKEQRIAEAVNEGLSLVKSAIKEGIKEAIDSHNFDRYGPGGWRSRDETLQGSVDCQRAGLFRHPTQCNKFYACHWDCTKQRYTLHVFNCPVHLTFDTTQGACNWPSKGPSCAGNTLLPAA